MSFVVVMRCRMSLHGRPQDFTTAAHNAPVAG